MVHDVLEAGLHICGTSALSVAYACYARSRYTAKLRLRATEKSNSVNSTFDTSTYSSISVLNFIQYYN
jgi:hypothetical protein